MMIDFRQPPPGFSQGIYDISFERYQAIPALNSSKLKQMRRSPLHFKTAIEDPELSEPTAAQKRTFAKGKAFDILILDANCRPEVLQQRVSIEPDAHRATKIYKEWLADQPEGNLILTRDELNDVLAMAAAAWKKNQFAKLFREGNPHRVIIWKEPDSGLWCKAEIDWITPDGIVVDLKSTADAGFWFFSRNARRLGYLNQAAHYLKGISVVTGFNHHDYRLAAVEVDKPYESHVFEPEPDQIATAMDDNKAWMEQIADCLESDHFPGYLDEIISLGSGQYKPADFGQDLLDYELEEETYGF
jgi:hypothetical protein